MHTALIRRRRGGYAFTPVSIFANGEVGAWFKPLDLSTLFQDTTGPTPVTTASQTVAVMLDQSEGAGYSGGEFTGLGPELVANGGFDADSDWIKGAGWTISGGVANNDGTINAIYQSEAIEAGKVYACTLDITFNTAGVAYWRLGNTTNLGVMSTNRTSYTQYLVGSADGNYVGIFTNANITIDNISVREIPGFHALQSGSSFRPQYQTTGLLYDATDDRLALSLKPTTSGTIIARFTGDTASRVIGGSQPASDGRCFLALDANGRLGAGIGTQSTSTIFGGSDIRGADHVGAVTWNGTTVKLYLDGAEIYSAAQSGAVNTTVSMMIGALNANGTAAAFWDGNIADQIILDRAMTPAEITNLTNAWSV